jgi:hypothetical protein
MLYFERFSPFFALFGRNFGLPGRPAGCVAKVEEGSTTATASGCSFPSSWAGSWFLRKEISPQVKRFYKISKFPDFGFLKLLLF